MTKKLKSILLLVCLSGAVASAQSFNVTLLPTLELPVGSSTDLLSTGGGADISLLYAFNDASGLRLSGTVGYRMLPSLGTAKLSLITLTGGVGYQYEVAPRLRLYSDLRVGGFYGMFDGSDGFDLTTNIGVGLDFAVSPSFSIGLGTSFNAYFSAFEPLYTGMGINITGGYIPGKGGTNRPRLKILEPEVYPIFPVLYKWYDSNPAGSIVIDNRENRTIRNIQASIFVQEFMDSPKIFADIEELGKGKSLDVPINILFNDGILGVLESMKVAAEIRVTYELGDSDLETTRSETLRIFDRNAITWEDDRSVASFVTAKDPVLRTLSRNVASEVREDGEVAGDINFRIAMAMYEALNLYGMSYVVDPQSSYADLSVQSSAVDYVQFPRQTLEYRTGDCDDLTILFCSLLESVGIDTAFVLVPGHILPAVALTLSPEKAQQQFSRSDRMILDQGIVYLPIESTILSKGFNAAWVEGARQWQTAGASASIVPVHLAWQEFEPVGLREDSPELIYPPADTIMVAYHNQMNQFVSEELAPRVDAIAQEIRNRGATPRALNRLGILYARYGRYAEAEQEFRKIISQEGNSYPSAMLNLANIHYMREEYSDAISWYDRVLRQNPQHPYALKGSIKARSETGDLVTASRLLDSLRSVDPASADSLAYLTNADTNAARASAAQSERSVDWDE